MKNSCNVWLQYLNVSINCIEARHAMYRACIVFSSLHLKWEFLFVICVVKYSFNYLSQYQIGLEFRDTKLTTEFIE